MKLLLDMNLSPSFCGWFESHGWHAVHWSDLGDPRETDRAIMTYAKENGFVVLTHDLDFGAILAATKVRAPSVIQIRTQDVLSERFRAMLLGALKQFEDSLLSGVLIVIDEHTLKSRILPLN